jgi:alkylhydroperoxidase/carboxymuconolactone decarboxylase family protein YurZ
LEATEHTYIDRDVLGLSNTRFRGDSVLEKYRDDIDDWLPGNFSESIDLSRPIDQYYYVYELTEPKRSRAIRKLRKVLEKNRPEIQAAFNTAADTATGLATAAAAATPLGVPVSVITPLAKPFSRIAFNSLLTNFERSLADTNMTPWSITHTTLYLPQYPVPLSMFILLSPAVPGSKLHRIHRDDIDPDVSTMDLGYEEKKRAYQRGRGMVGVSVPPIRPCPADLWTHVARENQPAAWTEPGQDQGGFRILVPHAEASDDAAYVSALRADLLEVDDKTSNSASGFVRAIPSNVMAADTVDVSQSTRNALAEISTGDVSVLEKALKVGEMAHESSGLDPRTFWLVRIAALVALSAPPASYQRQLSSALDSGVTPAEILGVLHAIAPQVGGPSIVSAAEEIMLALGLSLPD